MHTIMSLLLFSQKICKDENKIVAFTKVTSCEDMHVM